MPVLLQGGLAGSVAPTDTITEASSDLPTRPAALRGSMASLTLARTLRSADTSASTCGADQSAWPSGQS